MIDVSTNSSVHDAPLFCSARSATRAAVVWICDRLPFDAARAA